MVCRDGGPSWCVGMVDRHVVCVGMVDRHVVCVGMVDCHGV